jgi:hypothetical protein
MKTFLAILILTVSLAAQTARDVTEFTLFKRTEATQIGQVGLTLRGTDVNKQRYSIDLLIEGHKIERKDLDIKIPLYFYVGTNAQPHELVVFKVAADQVVGRLASPK